MTNFLLRWEQGCSPFTDSMTKTLRCEHDFPSETSLESSLSCATRFTSSTTRVHERQLQEVFLQRHLTFIQRLHKPCQGFGSCYAYQTQNSRTWVTMVTQIEINKTEYQLQHDHLETTHLRAHSYLALWQIVRRHVMNMDSSRLIYNLSLTSTD